MFDCFISRFQFRIDRRYHRFGRDPLIVTKKYEPEERTTDDQCAKRS